MKIINNIVKDIFILYAMINIAIMIYIRLFKIKDIPRGIKNKKEKEKEKKN
jgi:hypothetical protein